MADFVPGVGPDVAGMVPGEGPAPPAPAPAPVYGGAGPFIPAPPSDQCPAGYGLIDPAAPGAPPAFMRFKPANAGLFWKWQYQQTLVPHPVCCPTDRSQPRFLVVKSAAAPTTGYNPNIYCCDSAQNALGRGVHVPRNSNEVERALKNSCRKPGLFTRASKSQGHLGKAALPFDTQGRVQEIRREVLQHNLARAGWDVDLQADAYTQYTAPEEDFAEDPAPGALAAAAEEEGAEGFAAAGDEAAAALFAFDAADADGGARGLQLL
eukprot:tig00000190_g13835.t1